MPVVRDRQVQAAVPVQISGPDDGRSQPLGDPPRLSEHPTTLVGQQTYVVHVARADQGDPSIAGEVARRKGLDVRGKRVPRWLAQGAVSLVQEDREARHAVEGYGHIQATIAIQVHHHEVVRGIAQGVVDRRSEAALPVVSEKGDGLPGGIRCEQVHGAVAIQVGGPDIV